MVGTTDREDTVQVDDSAWSLTGCYQALAHSLYEVMDGSLKQATGTYQFIESLFSENETQSITSSVGYVVATDLIPIIIVNTAMASLDSYVKNQGFDPSFAIDMGLSLAKTGTFLFNVRKTTEGLSRVLIIQAKQASIFALATDSSRTKISDSVCTEKHKECSNMRYVKGNLRAPLFYVSQQAVIFALQKSLGDVLKLYGWDFIVDGYAALVLGRLIMGYRLANDGLCEPHQAVYNNEYWERILLLGIPPVLFSKAFIELIESFTGVNKFFYASMIESFLSLAMVGVAHNINWPKSLARSERFPTPVAMTRNVISYALNKITPDAQILMAQMLESDAPPINYFAKYMQFKAWYLETHLSPLRQVLAQCVMPPMYWNLQEFINDPIVRKYWPEWRRYALDVLADVQYYQDLATGKNLLDDNVKTYIKPLMKPLQKPLKKLLGPIAGVTLSTLEKHLIAPMIGHKISWKGKDVEKMLKVLRDRTLHDLAHELKNDIDNLDIDENREAGFTRDVQGLGSLVHRHSLFSSNRPVLQHALINENYLVLPNEISRDGVNVIEITPKKMNTALLVKTIKDSIQDYLSNISKFSSRINGVGALFDTASTLAAGSGKFRSLGKARANYYLAAFEIEAQTLPMSSSDEVKESLQLLICIGILTNEAAGELLDTVNESLIKKLSVIMPDMPIKQMSNTEFSAFIIDKLYHASYLKMPLSEPIKNECAQVTLGDFKRIEGRLIDTFVKNSNRSISIAKRAVSIESWHQSVIDTMRSWCLFDNEILARQLAVIK